MKPILISGAMDIEVQFLIESLGATVDKSIAGYDFYRANYHGKPIVISRTKVGMVNAATSTTLGILEYQPSMIINQGCFGGYGDMRCKDILLVSEAVNICSFQKGAGDAVDIAKWEHMNFDDDDRKIGSDTELIEIFSKLPYVHGAVKTGIIGSGDVWNRERKFIKFLQDKLAVQGEDMESVAVLTVANNFNLPCIGVRIVSNNECLGEEYDRSTVRLCQEFVLSAVSSL